MKRIIIAICLAAAGSAFADDITIEATPFVSSRSRAEVIAELQAARAAPNPWADGYDQLAAFRSTLTREEVVADFLLTRDEMQAFNGEDSGSGYLMAARSLGNVAPVLAQAGN
ncbi:DUF4148 domain-containing protein [Ramlibacter sp. XY19]|uniref:DUF4148 domain-containing protein n=1 Tax=Ramlibacter paludis TaxID=2908000 RepID=UPI0023DC3462|nr:DUF4148 domain-containing protein [Ramlibacter paludis]MCG2592549.1 DUF4148 domain-containing protein [Ramlibacter paludis]